MQEAEHQGEVGNEWAPGVPRRLNPVRAYGPDLVVGEDGGGFGDKLTIGFLQARTGGRRGHTDAQHAPTPYGGRDHHLFACQPRDLLIGNQILWHALRPLDGRPDQIEPPKAEPRPIPEHRITTKHLRQRPERHAPVAQEERGFALRCAPYTIQQQKRGPKREHRPARLELNPAQLYPLFARAIAVVESIPPTDRLRKQFWIMLNHRGQILTVLRYVAHTHLIVRFTLERHADMLAPTGWGRLLHLCVAHHSTVWQILARPSLLFFRPSANHKIR